MMLERKKSSFFGTSKFTVTAAAAVIVVAVSDFFSGVLTPLTSDSKNYGARRSLKACLARLMQADALSHVGKLLLVFIFRIKENNVAHYGGYLYVYNLILARCLVVMININV